MKNIKITGVNNVNLAAVETQLQKEGYKPTEPWNSRQKRDDFDCIYAYADGIYAIFRHKVYNDFNLPEITAEEFLNESKPMKEFKTFAVKSQAVFAATRVLFLNQILHTVDGNDILVNAADKDTVKQLFKSHLILFVCE